MVLPKLLSGYAYRDFNLVERLLTEGRVVVWYMSLLLWPDPARMSMEHDFEISTSLFSPLTTLPSLLLIAALIFLAIRFRRRFPVITYGIVWFFLNLVIESTIIPLELVFEHRLYLPSMGFYLSVAALLVTLFRWAASRLSESRICEGRLLAASDWRCVPCSSDIYPERRSGKTMTHDPLRCRRQKRPTAAGKCRLCQHPLRARPIRGSCKYAEKAIELGRKGREAGVSGPERPDNSPYKTWEERTKRSNAAKSLSEAMGSDVEAGALPNLCLNVARGYDDREETRRRLQVGARSPQLRAATDNALTRKIWLKRACWQSFPSLARRKSISSQEGVTDPGDLPPALLGSHGIQRTWRGTVRP